MTRDSSTAVSFRPSGRLVAHWPAAQLNSTLVNGLVLGALGYTLLFDFLDDGLRVAVAGVLGIAVVLRCLVSWAHPAGQAATYLFCGLILVCAFQFVFVADPRAHSVADYASLALRLMTCIAVLAYFGHERQIVSPRLLIVLCASVLVAALWAVATGEPFDYAGTMRPATFTGGPEGVHSSGYVAAAALVGTMVLWRRGRLGTGWSLVIGLPLLALVAAYQVRTTWLMVAVFVLTSLLLHVRFQAHDRSWLLFPIGVIIVVLIALAFSGGVNFAEVSSGRTSAYGERFELIAGRPALEFLFGTGPGSEVLPSTIWWWEAKNSHNDFIDLTIQVGVAGLALFLLLLAVTWRMLDDVRLPLYVTFVASSLFSNGLLARPFVAVLFLAFALTPRAPAAGGGD
jgi:hypothetical protein